MGRCIERARVISHHLGVHSKVCRDTSMRFRSTKADRPTRPCDLRRRSLSLLQYCGRNCADEDPRLISIDKLPRRASRPQYRSEKLTQITRHMCFSLSQRHYTWVAPISGWAAIALRVIILLHYQISFLRNKFESAPTQVRYSMIQITLDRNSRLTTYLSALTTLNSVHQATHCLPSSAQPHSSS